MRVALEATAACRPIKTGIARYAIELMRALAKRSDRAQPTDRFDAYYRLSRRWKKGHRPPSIDGIASYWFQEPIPPVLKRYDIVHGLDVRVPRWPGAHRVATLHDLFAVVSSEYVRPSLREKSTDRYRELAARCDHVIAVSENTRRDFLEQFDYPPERISVVHHGVHPSFQPRAEEDLVLARNRHGLKKDYLLYVGDLTPRKNLVRLIRAYARCKASSDFDLAIVGAREFRAEEIDSELAVTQSRARIHRLGYVGGPDLQLLYAGAAAFLFPTLYEGFGLPVLEAFASGTPVLSSNTSSIPEIAEKHAILIDPEDEAAIANGIDDVVNTPPENLEAARLHAGQFTWERCAQRTYDIYERLLDSS